MSRAALVLFCLAAATGCLSVDPVDFVAVESGPGDSSTVETTSEVAEENDAETSLDCYACIEAPDDPGPGCGDEYGTCIANAQCKAIMDCVYVARCFYLKTTKDFVACAIPCAAEAGVVETDDPVVTLGLNVAYCVDKVCRAFCGGGTTGS